MFVYNMLLSFRQCLGSLRLNLTSKSCKSACQKHDCANYWYFGSIVGSLVGCITQVTFTTVDFAFGDFR